MIALLPVLRVMSTITSFLLCVSPWPDYRRIVRDKNTGPLSMLPVLMLFTNCYMWSMYALLVGNIVPLFVSCTFGCVTCTVFMSIYYRWSAEKPKLNKFIAVAVAFITCWTTFTVLAAVGVIDQTTEQVASTLGYVCVAVNIGVYASPLDVMASVVKTKNAEALPISLCSVNLLNGILWLAFGLTAGDYFVFTPNAIGALLSAAQVGLYLKFPPVKSGGDALPVSRKTTPKFVAAPTLDYNSMPKHKTVAMRVDPIVGTERQPLLVTVAAS